MVQVSPNHTLFDVTIRGLPAGRYQATVRAAGDISRGAASTGGIWEAVKQTLGVGQVPRGQLGTIHVSEDGTGSALLDKPISIWEMVGRSMVVSNKAEGTFQQADPETLVGVIARSAGVWDNEKTVCSCSGKSVWEERREQKSKGMI